MVLLGGTGTLYGPILGALSFTLLEETLSRFTEHWKLILGPLLIGTVLFARGGIAGAIARRRREKMARSWSSAENGTRPQLNAQDSINAAGDRRGHRSWPKRGPVLRLEQIEKSFGALKATDRLSLDILANETHAIIGPNGAGKTTLIHQISGMLAPD